MLHDWRIKLFKLVSALTQRLILRHITESGNCTDIDGYHLIHQKDVLQLKGTDLQQALEDAFLRKNPWEFQFRIADQDYKMNFSPESDMSQENVRYGTKRKVRRRPSEFVTGNDIKR